MGHERPRARQRGLPQHGGVSAAQPANTLDLDQMSAGLMLPNAAHGHSDCGGGRCSRDAYSTG